MQTGRGRQATGRCQAGRRSSARRPPPTRRASGDSARRGEPRARQAWPASGPGAGHAGRRSPRRGSSSSARCGGTRGSHQGSGRRSPPRSRPRRPGSPRSAVEPSRRPRAARAAPAPRPSRARDPRPGLPRRPRSIVLRPPPATRAPRSRPGSPLPVPSRSRACRLDGEAPVHHDRRGPPRKRSGPPRGSTMPSWSHTHRAPTSTASRACSGHAGGSRKTSTMPTGPVASTAARSDG